MKLIEAIRSACKKYRYDLPYAFDGKHLKNRPRSNKTQKA